MASKFYLDGEGLPRRRRAALLLALGGLAVSDTPLLVELLFVSQEEIRALNARERGVDAVTDVLSFPADNFKAGEPILAAEHIGCIERRGKIFRRTRLYLGSVVICTARAEEQAKEYGHSIEREICYLAVHGVLHCLGYDHEREEDRKKMREKEETVMQKMGLKRE